MSYPPSSPFGYPDPLEAAKAPAKTASMMMWIFAPLMLLAGCCCLSIGGVYSSPEFQKTPQYQELVSKIENADVVLPLITAGGLAAGTLYTLIALVYGVMAYFVRKGGKGPVSLMLVVNIGVTVLLVLQGLLMLGQIPGGNCFSLLPAAYCGMLLIPLFQALKRAELVRQWTQYCASLRAGQQFGLPPAPPGGYPMATPVGAPPPPPLTPPPPPPPPENR